MSKDWISVKGMVPDHPVEVLIGGECCEVCYNIDIGFIEDGEWYLKGGDKPKWPITHWMPLPSPPPTTENVK